MNVCLVASSKSDPKFSTFLHLTVIQVWPDVPRKKLPCFRKISSKLVKLLSTFGKELKTKLIYPIWTNAKCNWQKNISQYWSEVRVPMTLKLPKLLQCPIWSRWLL